MTKKKKLLARAPNWLGDAVMSLPALTALTKEGDLTILTRAGAAPIFSLAHTPWEILVENKKLLPRYHLIQNLKQKNFDGAVLFQNALSAALVSFLAGIPERVGYARDGRRLLLNKPVELNQAILSAHESFYYLDLLQKGPPVNPIFTLPILTAPPIKMELPSGFLLALAPGAAFGSAKRWPIEKFSEAAKKIISGRSGSIIILGGPSEKPAADQLTSLLDKGPKVLNLAGQTSITEAAGILAQCRLLLTNDSGLMHLAGALGVPVVSLFGPTNPLTTGPLARQKAVLRNPVPCSPCLKRECPKKTKLCFLDLGSDEAAQAADLLLAKKQSEKGGAIFYQGPISKLFNNLKELVELSKTGLKIVIINNQTPLDFPGANLGFEPIIPQKNVPLSYQTLANSHSFELSSSFWLGDKMEDLKPASTLDGRSVLFLTEEAPKETFRVLTGSTLPDICTPNLSWALQWIKSSI